MNPDAARRHEGAAAAATAAKVKMTLIEDVSSLQDFDMTLGELKAIIDKFVQIHGPNARLRTDAGHNNVSFELYYEATAEDMKTFLAKKDVK